MAKCWNFFLLKAKYYRQHFRITFYTTNVALQVVIRCCAHYHLHATGARMHSACNKFSCCKKQTPFLPFYDMEICCVLRRVTQAPNKILMQLARYHFVAQQFVRKLCPCFLPLIIFSHFPCVNHLLSCHP